MENCRRKQESLRAKVNLAQSKNAAIWSQRFHGLLTWSLSDGHIYNYHFAYVLTFSDAFFI